ncbi:MAG: hypothetical protein AAFR16_11405, partial [Pseudomonadota bacterium]
MSDTADIGSEGESGLPEARAAAREAEIAVAAEAAFGGPAPQTLNDVAKLLSLPAWRLRNALFNDPDERRYASFEIPKRSGGVRRIDSPRGVIRQGQDRLLPILTALHRPHPSSHGFLEGRGIVTNAALHAG